MPLSWKIAMVIALFLIMRLVVRPLAHIYAVNFGVVGAVIACGLMYWLASVIERRGRR
jgi:hypothetical protein